MAWHLVCSWGKRSALPQPPSVLFSRTSPPQGTALLGTFLVPDKDRHNKTKKTHTYFKQKQKGTNSHYLSNIHISLSLVHLCSLASRQRRIGHTTLWFLPFSLHRRSFDQELRSSLFQAKIEKPTASYIVDFEFNRTEKIGTHMLQKIESATAAEEVYYLGSLAVLNRVLR